jgi:hypothetical protein
VIQILSEMPEERRLSIADKVRRRFLAEHTPYHRARQLESHYLEAMGQRARKTARRSATLSMQVAEA